MSRTWFGAVLSWTCGERPAAHAAPVFFTCTLRSSVESAADARRIGFQAQLGYILVVAVLGPLFILLIPSALCTMRAPTLVCSLQPPCHTGT